MSRRIITLAGVFFLAATVAGLAQEAQTTPANTLPAATRSQADCTGFVSAARVPNDLYVLGGADNDFHSPVRQFVTSENIFLFSRSGAKLSVGIEYALVRPAKELFHTSWYSGQHASIRSLGTAYQDVARVKVTRVTSAGAVAEVTFACGPVYTGDLAIPAETRPIPEYNASKAFDRFAPPSGHAPGAITAAGNNMGYLATGSIAYLNLGESDGVKVGQRYRIFHLVREAREGLWAFPDTPRESVGELIILSTQERSSAAIVVNSTREISLGDGVELE